MRTSAVLICFTSANVGMRTGLLPARNTATADLALSSGQCPIKRQRLVVFRIA